MRTLLLAGLLILVLPVAFVVSACGVEWFPKCNDPKRPCPDVEPNYPAEPSFGLARDASHD